MHKNVVKVDVVAMDGSNLILGKFVFRPVASPKDSRICATAETSCCVGERKMTASSVYSEVLILGGRPLRHVRCPSSVAFSKIGWSGSIARMSKKGESGSPCLTPLP